MACATAALAIGSPVLATDAPPEVVTVCGRWMKNPVLEDGQWRSKTPQEIEGSIDYHPPLPQDYSDNSEFDGSDDHPDDKWTVYVNRTEKGGFWDADDFKVTTIVDIKPGRVVTTINNLSKQANVSRDARAQYKREETVEWIAFDGDLAACPAEARRVYVSSNLQVKLTVSLTVAPDVGDMSTGVAAGTGFVTNTALPTLKVRDRGLTATVRSTGSAFSGQGRFAGEAGGGVVRSLQQVGGNVEVDFQEQYSNQASVESTGQYVGNVTYTLQTSKSIETADRILMEENVSMICLATANSINDSIFAENERSSTSYVSCTFDFGTDVQ
jgi:hypothetical protein